VGLETAGGLAEISAGVLGTAVTWVASTGSRAAGREAHDPALGRGLREAGPRFLEGRAALLGCCVFNNNKKRLKNRFWILNKSRKSGEQKKGVPSSEKC
jgi:hypothetical protein